MTHDELKHVRDALQIDDDVLTDLDGHDQGRLEASGYTRKAIQIIDKAGEYKFKPLEVHTARIEVLAPDSELVEAVKQAVTVLAKLDPLLISTKESLQTALKNIRGEK